MQTYFERDEERMGGKRDEITISSLMFVDGKSRALS